MLLWNNMTMFVKLDVIEYGQVHTIVKLLKK